MNGINLNEFVTLAITEIAKGVSEAESRLKDTDVLINPATDDKGYTNAKLMYGGELRNVQTLEFDLSVSVSSENKVGGSGDIKVLGLLSLGGGAGSTANNSTTSRLRFSIPVSLPTPKQKK